MPLNPIARPRPGWRSVLALMLLVAFTGVTLALTPWGSALEEGVGINTLYLARGVLPSPPETVVISIDRSSAETLGLPNKPERWPRAFHARLIENLKAHGAAVIAFDLFFKEPSADDQRLASSITHAGNVILLEMLEGGDATGKGLLWAEQRLQPQAVLISATRSLAPFSLPKLPVRLNQYWTFKPGAGEIPTVPLVALQLYTARAYAQLLTTHPDVAKQLPAPPHADALAPQDFLRRLRLTLTRDQHMIARLNTIISADHTLAEIDKTALQRMLSACVQAPSRYLYLYGPPGTITTIPYAQAWAGDLPDLHNKAVFVGYAERILQEQRDSYYTVYSQPDGRDIAGVEIAATAYANLLRGETLEPLPPLLHLLVLFLWSVAVAALCVWLRPVPAAAAVFIVALVYGYAAHIAFSHYAAWWPTAVPILIQAPLALGAALLWRYTNHVRARRTLKRAMGYYLPAAVVESMDARDEPVRAGGQLCHGVCLYTDAEQYTALSETLTPETLSSLMNAYYAVLFAPVRRHGGIVSDVVGDAMLALWAQSGSDPETRAAACRAACDIAREVDVFNQHPQRPRLPTRIGVHSGEVVLGNVGALDHYEYRAVGDMVNTANRIQGLNKQLGTRILASAEVVSGLEEFATRCLGGFLLAGKRQPVVIHELLGLKTQFGLADKVRIEQFNEGLQLFNQGDWGKAASAFASLLATTPHDGPARYFYALCQHHGQNPPINWTGVVTAGEK